MCVPRSRLTMAVAALAAGLLTIGTDAQAQVRRNIGGATPPPPATEPPADTAPEAPADEGEQPERQVDPEWVARTAEQRGISWLLEQEAIRKEIGVTDEQLAKLEKVNTMVDEHRQQVFEQMRELRDQARNQGGPGGGRGGPGGFPGGDMRQMFEALQQQSTSAIAQVLSSKQIARLYQILLQAKGDMAVTEPEMLARLQVLPAEAQQIQAIKAQLELEQRKVNDARSQAMRDLFAQRREQQQDSEDEDDNNNRRGRPQLTEEDRAKFDQYQEQADALEKAALKKIGQVLGRYRISQFNKLKGEPFDFNQLDLTGGGPGGSGGPAASAAVAAAVAAAAAATEPTGRARRSIQRPRRAASRPLVGAVACAARPGGWAGVLGPALSSYNGRPMAAATGRGARRTDGRSRPRCPADRSP